MSAPLTIEQLRIVQIIGKKIALGNPDLPRPQGLLKAPPEASEIQKLF
jgi:hypothetical protein